MSGNTCWHIHNCIPNKIERIERLSALRWGTPCAEVDALIFATLRNGDYGLNGGVYTPAGAKPTLTTEPFKLSPDLEGPDERSGGEIQDDEPK